MATVGQSQVLQACNTFEDLKHQAVDVLQRYYHHSQDLQAQGSLTGSAGSTNVITAEEIQQASMKIQNRWDQLIQLVRDQTHSYGNVDQHNAAQIQAVGSELNFH